MPYKYLESHPERASGELTIKGTRIRIAMVINMLAHGFTLQEQPFQHVYGGCRAQTLCGRNERQPKHVRSENEGHLATYWLLAQQFRC